jgi:hypothetical protein
LELRKFDLRFTFARLCMLGKDIEDDGRSVNHLDFDSILESTALAGRKLSVGHDGVSALGKNDGRKFFDLAPAEVGRGVRIGFALKEPIENLRTCRFTKCSKFFQRVFGVNLVTARINANNDDLLESDLAVFDLGDVLEFSSKATNSTEGRSILKVHLADGRKSNFKFIHCK